MKKISLALIALAVAVPASASDFTGPRLGANLGLVDDDIFGAETLTWGVEAGYDVNVKGAIVGASVEFQDDFGSELGRELSASVRVGAPVAQNTLVYVSAGYTNLDVYETKLDGVRFGLGAEVNVLDNAFVKFEQRYANYEYGVEGYQSLVGVGFRF